MDTINNVSPINQVSKHTTLSEKYKFFSTQDVVDKFNELGFVVSGSSIRKTRVKDRQGFQKHMVMFRSEELADLSRLDKQELIPEILFTNAHDGTSSGRFHLGLFRTFCSNGLVVCDQSFDLISLRHSEKGLIELIPTVERLKVAATNLVDKVNKLKSISLTEEQRRDFAIQVARFRLPQVDPNDIDVTALLQPVRDADRDTDLFTTMNVVQEKVVRLGVNYKGLTKERGTENYIPKLRRSRSLKAIDANLELNRMLWKTAEQFAA